MKHRVTFFPGNVAVDVNNNETILDAAVAADVYIDASCGGEGTCGKCRVIIEGPHNGSVDKNGYVLACQTSPKGELSVFVPTRDESRVGKIHGSYSNAIFKVDKPLVENILAEMRAPSLDDNLADLERLKCAIDQPDVEISLSALQSLPDILRSSNWCINTAVAHTGNSREIIDIFSSKHDKNIGVAIDIGTTTVALELIDLNTGAVIAQASDYNRQIIVGEDVLARIAYVEERGPKRLQDLIIKTINQLIENIRFVDEDRVGSNQVAHDIRALSVGANPAMLSLFLGLDPTNIRYEPYIPVAHEPPIFRASDIGLNIHPNSPIYCIPGRAAYVGGDVTADILLSGMHLKNELSLLIDVGTNGEVVLGNREWMVTCSTSAGPAFEGGDISCGMRAMSGAIDSVEISGGDLQINTIDSQDPVGICGSGLIDLVAQMFKDNWIDRKGNIVIEDSERFYYHDEVASALIHSGENTISINEDDIANILRTKAAIYAGCSVLLSSMGMEFNDVEKIYIAGGFGSHINIDNAQLIGLLPDLPRERFEFIGNGSLGGARLCLISADARKAAHSIFESMTYLDLSSSPAFFDQYSSALFLPHTDLDQFPSIIRRMK